ncbi:MAG: spondin domain-containing protein [Proteobacteria bacterium]|nr:spondin domain-containing protein [Pseudomonadota bacterium]
MFYRRLDANFTDANFTDMRIDLPVASAVVALILAAMMAVALTGCKSSGSSASTGAPILANVAKVQSYPIEQAIPILRISNTGGKPVSCKLLEGQTLPLGLSVGVSSDQLSCAVSGTPSLVTASKMYTVIATNNAGNSMATVSIEIGKRAVTSCAVGSAASARTTMYRVTFLSTWSPATNGGLLPANAGFSALIGVSHTEEYFLWTLGGRVTAAVEMLVEEGDASALKTEFIGLIDNRTVGLVITGGALTSAAGSVNVTFEANCAFPRISLLARMEPSPDWFTGISRLSLLDDTKEWIDDVERDLFVHDAGTEIGDRFITTGANVNPPEAVSRLTGNQAIGFNAGRQRIGRLTLLRLK